MFPINVSHRGAEGSWSCDSSYLGTEEWVTSNQLHQKTSGERDPADIPPEGPEEFSLTICQTPEARKDLQMKITPLLPLLPPSMLDVMEDRIEASCGEST